MFWIRSFYKVLLLLLYLFLKFVLKLVYIINLKVLFLKSMNEIRLSGYMFFKKGFLKGLK